MNNFFYMGPNSADPLVILRLYQAAGPIGVDTETPTLEDTRLLGASFAINPTESFYFTAENPLFPWAILENPNIRKVFHNAGFDLLSLKNYKPGLTIQNYVDTCLAAQLLSLPAKLSNLCEKLFGRVPRNIQDLIGKGATAITMAEVPVDRVAERCNLDAIDCLEAWLKIESIIPKKAFDLEMRFLPVANKIQSLGIPIDRAAVHAHRTRLETEYNYMKMISEGSLGFNPGSTIQLAAILEGQGYVVPYKTTEGKRRPILNKQVLETYYSQVAIAQWVLKYRSTQTLLTHLIKPLDNGEYLTGDKIHPKINLNTVRSGRISRSVPATQNIKESLRDIIVTTDPVNNQLISQDLSQIELRLAAWMWDDKEMLKIFAAGGDIHEGTAQALIDQGLGNILLPTPRRVAKDINYLVLYGGDEYTMYNRKQIPMITGKKIFDAYFQTFKGIAYGIEATKEFARNNGYVETLYGRRRDESEKLGGNRKQVAAALREMVNHVIQGSAAELNKEILIALKDEPIIHTVHDEWIADAPIGHQLPSIEGIMPFHTPIAEGRGKTWQQAAH